MTLKIVDDVKVDPKIYTEEQLEDGNIYRVVSEFDMQGDIVVGFRYQEIRAFAINAKSVYNTSNDIKTYFQFVEIDATLTVES